MQRVDVVLKDRARTFEPDPVDADGQPVKDSGGVPKRGRETTPSHKIKVLQFEDRLRIVRDGADENSTGVEVFVKDGYLDASDFDGPIAAEPVLEEPPAAPAADEPPPPPPEV